MKLVVLIIASMTHISCASMNALKKISFESVKQMDFGGEVSKKDILEKYGTPDEVDHWDGQEYLVYKEDAYLRVKFVIQPPQNTLNAVMWFPRENEQEFKVVDLLGTYGKENFKVLKVPTGNPHLPMPNSQYISEKYKMTAYSDVNHDQIDTIIFSNIIDRNLAATAVK